MMNAEQGMGMGGSEEGETHPEYVGVEGTSNELVPTDEKIHVELAEKITPEQAHKDLDIIDRLMDEARDKGISEEGMAAIDLARKHLEGFLKA
jgi:hypothetical protein